MHILSSSRAHRAREHPPESTAARLPHGLRLPLGLLLVAATIGLTMLLAVAGSAYASAPKWFAREAVGQPEHELSGTIKLKPVGIVKLSIYLEGEGNIDLADGCNASKVEGVSITGGSPGTAKINKIVLSQCEEALSEPCTVKSTTESLTFENLTGELVYTGAGNSGPVAIRFAPKEASIGVKCKTPPKCPGMGTTETIRTEFLPHVSNSFTYGTEAIWSFSRLFAEYFNNSTGKREAVVNTAKGPVERDVAAYESSLHLEPEEAPAEDHEIKAE
jgi:hypothetical protein